MAKSQSSRRKEAGQAKRQEIIDLLKSMGHTKLSNGSEINSLNLNQLQEIYKYGIKK